MPPRAFCKSRGGYLSDCLRPCCYGVRWPQHFRLFHLFNVRHVRSSPVLPPNKVFGSRAALLSASARRGPLRSPPRLVRRSACDRSAASRVVRALAPFARLVAPRSALAPALRRVSAFAPRGGACGKPPADAAGRGSPLPRDVPLAARARLLTAPLPTAAVAAQGARAFTPSRPCVHIFRIW